MLPVLHLVLKAQYMCKVTSRHLPHEVSAVVNNMHASRTGCYEILLTMVIVGPDDDLIVATFDSDI